MDYPTAHRHILHHQLAVFGALLVAFFFSFVLMFIHPTAALVVFAIALVGLFAGVIHARGLRREELEAARSELAHEACPKCGAKVEHDAGHLVDWHCKECGATFTPEGSEME